MSACETALQVSSGCASPRCREAPVPRIQLSEKRFAVSARKHRPRHFYGPHENHSGTGSNAPAPRSDWSLTSTSFFAMCAIVGRAWDDLSQLLHVVPPQTEVHEGLVFIPYKLPGTGLSHGSID